jgi:hypothetical protein
MITIVFFDTKSDFAKFVTQKERIFTYTKLHMAAIECELAMCIRRLVDLQALHGVKI